MTEISNVNIPTGCSVAFVSHWNNMVLGDDGAPLHFAQYTDKSVQVVGTFGLGGTLRFEGSNNGTDWSVLTDPQGNPLDFTSAKIEMVSEATLYVRPRVTAGDDTTNLSVYVLMKE